MRQFWLEGEDWRFVRHGIAIVLGSPSSCAEWPWTPWRPGQATAGALKPLCLSAEALTDAGAQAKAIQLPGAILKALRSDKGLQPGAHPQGRQLYFARRHSGICRRMAEERQAARLAACRRPACPACERKLRKPDRRGCALPPASGIGKPAASPARDMSVSACQWKCLSMTRACPRARPAVPFLGANMKRGSSALAMLDAERVFRSRTERACMRERICSNAFCSSWLLFAACPSRPSPSNRQAGNPYPTEFSSKFWRKAMLQNLMRWFLRDMI